MEVNYSIWKKPSKFGVEIYIVYEKKHQKLEVNYSIWKKHQKLEFKYSKRKKTSKIGGEL